MWPARRGRVGSAGIGYGDVMHNDLRPGVLFDVDGTLVDTNYLHTLAWSRALREAGEWAPMNAIHRLIGMGSDQLVERLLGHDAPRATEARARCYRDLFGDIRSFPGAAHVVERVHRAGLAVVLATSSPTAELSESRRALGLDHLIDSQTTADDVAQSKPAPDVFHAALDASDVDPARAIVVGDSVWDVEAARAAGIACIGVESGGFSRHELSERGAIAVYRDVGELASQFNTSPLHALVA